MHQLGTPLLGGCCPGGISITVFANCRPPARSYASNISWWHWAVESVLTKSYIGLERLAQICITTQFYVSVDYATELLAKQQQSL